MTFQDELHNIKEELLTAITYEERFDNLDEYYCNDLIAKDVIKSKYFAPWESAPLDMWLRCAWGAAQAETGTFEQKLQIAKDFLSILTDFAFVPGGRINYGLGRDDINVSYSNCYVLPIKEDSLQAIYDCVKEDALTYKTGGGCGNDISILRPENSDIKGSGGKSCGATGFMELFSTSTDTVSQQARRGALMLSLLCSHPDIEKFVVIKNDIENTLDMIKTLMEKYPESLDEFKELEKILNAKRAVQHANISVKLTDDYLMAVEKDEDYDLTWGGKIFKTIKANSLWHKIIHNAWSSAEPGLIFWDRMKETNNLEYINPILSTNPCIVGDTLIATADSRNAVSIKQLMEEGKDVPVYSTNLQSGQVEIKMGRNARKTGEKREVWKLILDDGSCLIATPGHKILLKNLQYKELKDLKPGDLLVPYNKKYMETEAWVVSVEFYGHEDVYNISVDDNHNYYINPQKFVAEPNYSGICIKNCSEIPLGAYGNCLLGHVNLVKCLYKENGKWHFDKLRFKNIVRIAMRFLDNIITLNDGRHALPEQNEVALNERRTGLGITGLGDMLIMLGLRYDSNEAIEFVDKIMESFRNEAYLSSIELSKERGSFPWYNEEGFFKSKFAQGLPIDIQQDIKNYGIRNGMLLTCAPVGTGSIIAQTSSGIEPIFRLSYIRKVKNVDNVSFTEYKIYNPIVEKLLGVGAVDPEIPSYVVDSSQIDPISRVKMQATIQKYIDNSISSTVNLPKDATEKDVEDIYMAAWKMGCKGITVYREGSRDGILVSIDEKTKTPKKKPIDIPTVVETEKINTRKRPSKLSGETYKLKVDLTGEQPYNCYLTVNFKDGEPTDKKKPFEVLVTETNSNKGMKDVVAFETTTRLVSLALRHDIPIEYIIDQLEKIQGQYIYSLPVSIAKVLANYVDNKYDDGEYFDDEIDGDDDSYDHSSTIVENDGLGLCPKCGKRTLKREGGCMGCVNPLCLYGKCN